MIDIVREACDAVGGATALARMIGVKPPALYIWKRVPGERAIAIEKATNGKVTRHRLRPDLYPQESAA